MGALRFAGRLAGAGLLAAVLVSCAGADEPVLERTPSATAAPQDPAASAPADDAVPPDTSTRRLESSAVVVEAEIDGEIVEFGGDPSDATDPFSDFVSCSGSRAMFTSYALVVSTSSGDVRGLTVATDDLVDEPGIHDATVHVELADGSTVDAAGTLTLDEGFRTGSFTAFSDAGALLKGTFECGAGPAPAPLTLGDDDGRLDTVDAVALLRTAQGERLVSLVAAADQGAVVQCPAAEDSAPETDVIVLVDGDSSIGAMTTFELLGGASPMLVLRVGAVEYRFDDVVVTGDGATGTFSATADGFAVDGAYRCT